MNETTYTHGHHASVLRSHRWRTVENSAAYLLARLRPGLSVLDVGCGPGTITLDLARRVAPGAVVGVDASGSAVDAARADAAVQGVPVEFRVGDAYALGVPDASVDVVHAHQVLQHLADPVAALTEWRRVCRPAGVVAVRDADYAAMCWHPSDPLLDEWLDVYRRVARTNGGEPDAARHLVEWAHAARFSSVEASTSAWCFAAPSDRAWWGDTWAERVRQSAFAAQAVEQGHATAAALEAMAAAWQRWVAEPDGWFAVLHGEILCTP